MSGTTNIYGPATNKKVARTVKNFNAKRSRELKKDPGAAAWLPEKISTKQFKEENRTRADVNRELRALQQFSREPVKLVEVNEGLTRTAWEWNKFMKVDRVRTDKSRAQRLADIEPSIERGTLGLAEKHNLEPLKVNPEKMSKADFLAKARTARTEGKSDFRRYLEQAYANNYRELIRDKMGPWAGAILDLIKNVSPAQMVQAYKNNPSLEIGFIYDPQEQAALAQELLQGWSEFLGLDYAPDDSFDNWEGDTLDV